MSHDLGQFRSLLAAPPSTANFEAIVDLIDPFDDDVDMLAAYLVGNLARWPHDIERPIPEDFLHACYTDTISPLLVLCNTLHAERLSALSQDSFALLMRSSVLESLTTLRMGGWFHDIDLGLFLQAHTLTRLRHIKNEHHEYSGNAIVEFFEHVDTHFQLQTLDLGCCSLSRIDALRGARCLRELTHLSMPYNALDDTQIATLVELELPSLTHLDLRHNPAISSQSATLLASAPFEHLAWLDMHIEDIGEQGARALATSPTLPAAVRRYWSALCPPTT